MARSEIYWLIKYAEIHDDDFGLGLLLTTHINRRAAYLLREAKAKGFTRDQKREILGLVPLAERTKNQ